MEKELNHIQKYWKFYSTVFCAIVAWTTLFIRVDSQDKRLVVLEARQDTEELILLDIQTRLSAIETNIEWIKINLNQ